MKISELIEILKKYDGDMKVWSLGVDSSGYSHETGEVNVIMPAPDGKRFYISFGEGKMQERIEKDIEEGR